MNEWIDDVRKTLKIVTEERDELRSQLVGEGKRIRELDKLVDDMAKTIEGAQARIDELVHENRKLAGNRDLLKKAIRATSVNLRDQFAAAALTGLLARHGDTGSTEPGGKKPYAKIAIKWADAMMEARKEAGDE